MNEQVFAAFITDLKEKVPKFVRNMQSPAHTGQYRFSWSGDTLSGRKVWGLGQSTFAARVLYILDDLDPLTSKNIGDFILGFERKNGEIFDPVIARKSFIKRMAKGLLYRNPDLVFNRLNRRAETRQALAALINLDRQPQYFCPDTILSGDAIDHFVSGLDWSQPWGAGSHVNHQMFFLRYFSGQDKVGQEKSANYFIGSFRVFEQEHGFHTGVKNVSPKEIVGGLMKLYMALSLFDRTGEIVQKSHVDLCLDKMKATDACEHFNTVYVLYHCARHLDYRREEIAAFSLDMASQWQQHFYPDLGGFSFGRGQSGKTYYGAIVSKGLDEPDLHGTAMFVWGLLVVARILGMDKKLSLLEPVL